MLKNIVNLSVEEKNIAALILPLSLIVFNFVVFDSFTWQEIGYICYKDVSLVINSINSETIEYVLGLLLDDILEI